MELQSLLAELIWSSLTGNRCRGRSLHGEDGDDVGEDVFEILSHSLLGLETFKEMIILV